ncbi:lipid-A-disaccharide synthase [Magnetococcales bacterium HHB-1]
MSGSHVQKKVILVAGEASGDFLGKELLLGLKERFPGLIAKGVGGPGMRAVGLQGAFDINDLSVIGLIEVFRRLPRLIEVFRYLVKLLEQEKPDLLITIDLPDFNFMLAKQAKKRHIPVVHYVSPQVWAWRRGRVKKIAALLDHLLLLFPFEQEVYAQEQLPVSFVGHPLAYRAKATEDRAQIRMALGLNTKDRLIALLPGSRLSEIKRMLPLMIETCQKIAETDVHFVLICAPSLTPLDLKPYLPEDDSIAITIQQHDRYNFIAAADVALVTSGTATLETALLGTPMVVAYRVNPVTYWIAQRVINVPYISLVNLVAKKALVQERLQKDANATQLADDLMQLLKDHARLSDMRDHFNQIHHQLTSPPKSAAVVVAEMLD